MSETTALLITECLCVQLYLHVICEANIVPTISIIIVCHRLGSDPRSGALVSESDWKGKRAL